MCPSIHRITDVAPADLPHSLRILLENLLRHEDGERRRDRSRHCVDWGTPGATPVPSTCTPSRVFLHDTNGVPVLVDLAAMRDAMWRSVATPLGSTR